MGGVEREERAAVLHGKSEARRRHSRSEAVVDALDQGHGVALAIDDREVHRVAREQVPAVGDGAGGALGIDPRCLASSVLGRKEPLDRDAGEVGVGVEARAVLVGELLRLDERVGIRGGVCGQGVEVERREDVQHLERDGALRVRRQLPDVGLSEAEAERLDPVRRMRLKVLHGEERPEAARACREPRGDVAAIERSRPLVGDGREGVGERGVAKRLARARGATAREECRSGASVLGQQRRVLVPRARNHGRNGKPAPRGVDRRAEQLAPREASEPRVQRGPAIHAPRDRPRQRTAQRHAIEPALAKCLGSRRARRAAARVEADRAAGARRPDEREEVAAESAAHRLDEAEGDVRGDRGIDGVAAGPERVDADLHGERLARGDHAACRDRRKALRTGFHGTR